MITREDGLARVTYYGAAPVIDHEGYAVEIGCEEATHLCQLRVATTGHGRGAKLRVDLAAAGVREVLARLFEWEVDNDASGLRQLVLWGVEWLRANDSDYFRSLAFYMQSCLTEGSSR